MEATEPRILRPQTRVRYLKIIALFKIGKGILLLCFGLSVFVLNSRPAWVDAVSDWIDDEALVVHGKAAHFLLTRLQEVLQSDTLYAAAVVALFYAAVLFTEGIGVSFQKRWAEFLMIIATAALIPLEVRHLLVQPSIGGGVYPVSELLHCLVPLSRATAGTGTRFGRAGEGGSGSALNGAAPHKRPLRVWQHAEFPQSFRCAFHRQADNVCDRAFDPVDDFCARAS